MNEIKYNGSTYSLISGKWADKNYMIVSESLQHKLNLLYSEQLDYSSMSAAELIECGANYKETNSLALAEKCFNIALEKADGSQIRRILPSLTSIYRQIGNSKAAVDLFERVEKQYGNGVISSALMTSVGAAYCDLKLYSKAKKACDRAFAVAGGKAEGELSAVYGRIRKEAPMEII